jgi:NAD-dependent SIR2 family protein deacetylase
MAFVAQIQHTDAIERSAAAFRSARQVVALTGAGISTPSGIPDFPSATNRMPFSNGSDRSSKP